MKSNPTVVSLSDKTVLKIALVGNPNSGKSTLFNALTGLSQKTGNFPGVTVDKKSGLTKLNHFCGAEFIDLPGTYSLYPKSLDELVTYEVLCDPTNPDYPDVTIIVIDASNLKRSLFLLSQIIDLRIPVILVLNMIDLVEKDGDFIDTKLLSQQLGIHVISASARNNSGINEIKQALLTPVVVYQTDFINVNKLAGKTIGQISAVRKVKSDFDAFQIISNIKQIRFFDKQTKAVIGEIVSSSGIDVSSIQSQETIERYKKINKLTSECITRKSDIKTESFTHKLDNILTHRIGGYVIFLGVLFLIFQTLFFLAEAPTEWIEQLFVFITNYAKDHLPEGELSDLFINGLLAGLGGIVVFIPQIALLFAFIAVLEDTGYMARVSFIMDKLMRKFGLNGRSAIPLISGVACAIPAIMSARTISNWKERIITILVTPLMSCSARLPVYTLLISLIVPRSSGFFNYQGLILMSLYLIGFIAAMGAAFVMKYLLKSNEKSYFIMELPVYRLPQIKTIGFTILDKIKLFLFDAGKIILAISVILWFLSSHAPGERFEQINNKYNNTKIAQSFSQEERDYKIASEKLEASYAGILGKIIEPIIAPLGFDWKIGIALVTSFAAREVFVGTMATIYSIGDSDNTQTIGQKMKTEINAKTGHPQFTVATGFSLMLFYAFAMQCMSTLAVVYHETRNWKWPVIQFFYMGALAYLSSLLIYQLFH